MTTTPTTDPVVWRTASARAEAAPDAPLPCPGCGTRLKGSNLRSHCERVHPIDRLALDPTPIVGLDRRIHRAYGVAGALGLAVVAGLLAVFPDRHPAPDTPPAHALAAIGRSPALVAIAVGLALLAVGAAAHRVRPPRASILVADGAVILRHRLGTGRRRVEGSLTVETGSLVRRVPIGTSGTAGSESSFPSEDEHAGTYLRVSGRNGHVTIGCPSSTRVRKHWSGWTSGPRRRWWDVTVAPAGFVALQYALAAEGAMSTPSTTVRAGGR